MCGLVFNSRFLAVIGEHITFEFGKRSLVKSSCRNVIGLVRSLKRFGTHPRLELPCRFAASPLNGGRQFHTMATRWSSLLTAKCCRPATSPMVCTARCCAGEVSRAAGTPCTCTQEAALANRKSGHACSRLIASESQSRRPFLRIAVQAKPCQNLTGQIVSMRGCSAPANIST
jgi:hypothetical protein